MYMFVFAHVCWEAAPRSEQICWPEISTAERGIEKGLGVLQTGSRPGGSSKGGRARSSSKQAAGRPLRCGSCFTCRNKQLKKACLRNKELRDQGLEVPTMTSPTRPPLAPARFVICTLHAQKTTVSVCVCVCVCVCV